MTEFPDPTCLPVLYPAQEIEAKIVIMASDIRTNLGTEFLMVPLLKGSFIFAADLVRALYHEGCQPEVDFMTLASYGTGTTSSGEVEIHQSLSDHIAGKPVLLVDDILESGRTLSLARDILQQKQAASVSIAVLLEKPGKRKVEINADFVGFTIPDQFVVGYGLDYASHYRELPFIATIPPSA